MYKICIAITIINSVILVYSSAIPQVQSVYEVIKNDSQNENIKCLYLRETDLINPEPEFLKTCVDFGKYSLLKSVTKATENDALCILYYNSFLSLCYNSNNLTAEKYKLVTMENKMPTNVTGACATLKQVATIVARLEVPLSAILPTLKSEGRCSRLCSDLDGKLLPICGKAAYMVSATALVNTANFQADKEKHIIQEVKKFKVKPVTQSEIPQSRENEHFRSNASADDAKALHVKDHDDQKENSSPKVKESTSTSQLTQESPLKHDNAKLPVDNSKTAINPVVDKSVTDNEKSVIEKLSNPAATKSETPVEITPEKPPTQTEEQSKPETEKGPKNPPVIPKNPHISKSPADDVPKNPDISKSPADDVPKNPDISKNPPDISKNPADTSKNPHPIQKNPPPVLKNPVDIPKKDSKPEIPATVSKNDISLDPDVTSFEKMKEDELMNPNEQEEGGSYGSHDGEIDSNNDGLDSPKPKEVEKLSTNAKPHETKEDTLPLNYGENIDSDDSYFFSYFMMVCAVFILAYVGYHNKQKVLALVLEGRRGRRPSRARRPNSANYHKLDSNLEEAVTSSCNKNATNIIY